MQLWPIIVVAAALASCGPSSPRVKTVAHAAVDFQDPSRQVHDVTTVYPIRASANLTMAGGDLHVFIGDSGKLAEAEFQYDWVPMRPELKMTPPDPEHDLLDRMHANTLETVPVLITVTQPDLPERAERSENVWKIALNGARVTHVAVTQGVGAAEIAVVGSAVESLDLRLGAGSMTVDLTRIVRSLTGHIELNNGRLILKLPRQHGVKVHRKIMTGYAMLNGADQKDATWTSPGFDAAAVKADLDVLVMAGELEMTTE